MTEINVNDKETLLLAESFGNKGSITVVCPRCKKFRKVVNTGKSDSVLIEYCRSCGQHYTALINWDSVR